MKDTLDAEVLEGIRSFSGLPEEMTPGEKLLSEGKALQKVQTGYTTAIAVQQPRSIAKVTANVLAESKLAGAAFYYRWPVKNKKTGKTDIVEGPSIDLTMCIARNYGNCVVDIDGTETPTHFMFKGTFIDLETGFTVPRLYRQRKGQNIGGGYGDDRSEDIVFQIGQSKAQRNAIAKAAPGWLIDQAIEEARDAEIKKIKPENLAVARAKVIEFFGRYGTTIDRLEAKIGKKADVWTAETIADFKGMATALREGRISADELFPAYEPKEENRTDPGKPPSPPPTDEKTAFRSEWINLKSKGYATYVQSPNNYKLIESMGQKYSELYQEMKDKWASLYPEHPWPLVEQAPPPSDDDEEVEENPTGEPGGTIEPPPSDDDEKIEIRIREVLDSIPKADSGIFESVGFQEFCRKRAKELTNYMELIAPYPSASDVPAGKRGGVLRKLVEAKIKSEGSVGG